MAYGVGSWEAEQYTLKKQMPIDCHREENTEKKVETWETEREKLKKRRLRGGSSRKMSDERICNVYN